MMQIYDKVSPLKMPTGVVKTAEEMKASGQYNLLFDTDCVIDVSESGTFRSYRSLEQLRESYDVWDKDPYVALEKIKEIIESRKVEKKTIIEQVQEIQAIQQSQDQAIMELAIMMAGEEVM